LKKLVPLILILCVTSKLCGQELHKISGVVLDSLTGQAVSDVHVSTAARGTTSNEAGKFCISIERDDVIYFTHVNYHPAMVRPADTKGEDPLTVVLRQHVKILREVRVSATPSENELKNRILAACPPATKEEENARLNSTTINNLGRIAPPPVPTLSEQFFESLEGPKGVTFFSSDPRKGLLAIIRNQNPKRRPSIRPSGYRPDPAMINPFVIKIHLPDSVQSDSTIFTRKK
jgi:hypothetical protein